jgi:hypothetical protein
MIRKGGSLDVKASWLSGLLDINCWGQVAELTGESIAAQEEHVAVTYYDANTN